MGRGVAIAKAAVRSDVILPILFLCALLTGCDNSCVAFVSNPGGGTLSVSANNGTCHITTQPTGNVRIRFSGSSSSIETWREAGIEHVFVSIREIDAHLGLAYGEDSSGWQELAPNLKERPVQIDLMPENDNSSPMVFLSEAAVPAGEYTQLRIVLASDEPAAREPIQAANACEDARLNCIITDNGTVRELTLSPSQTTTERILIPADRAGGAIFRVFPGTTSNVELEFNSASSQVYIFGSKALFIPSFVARCDFTP